MELENISRFLMQFGLVLAGAASFWAWVFLSKAGKSKTKETQNAYRELNSYMARLFFIGGVWFVILWVFNYFFVFSDLVFGHEGLVEAGNDYLRAGFQFNAFWVFIFAAFVVLGLGTRIRKKYAKTYFGITTTLTSTILIFTAFSEKFDIQQLSLSLRNWHSILTLGTVLCVDFLYFATQTKDETKRVLYKIYPAMSLAIWFGLGLDFFSSFLTFEGDFLTNAQFFFNQAVVAVIVLNGAVLSIKLNDYLIGLIKPNRVERPSGKMAHIIHISGSISIVSWLTATFLNFVELSWALPTFIAIYLAAILIVYFSEHYVEKLFIKK